ncbi:MAG TPA: hypothetical protein VEJ86_06305 [Candidatus Binataceae bacterium]|nr:hypothetical protein [Candidatus Binataceae bacterium]
MQPRRPRSLLLDTPAVALLLAAVVYLRGFSNQFVYDDKDLILKNAYIGKAEMLWRSWVRDLWWFLNPQFQPNSSNYHPLQATWLWLNYQLFGVSPPGWHLSILAVHLVAVWLVFAIARELSANRLTPFGAAALFAVLPIHAEAVVWPAAIPETMSAAFELGAFLCFISSAAGQRRRLWAGLWFAAALLTHESA